MKSKLLSTLKFNRIFVAIMLMVLCLGMGQVSWGQTAASATWAGTTDNTAANVGNVTGGNQSFGGALTNTGFSGTNGFQGQTWPTSAYTTSQTNFYQFVINPTAGNNLTVTSVSLQPSISGPGSATWAVYYSTSASFTSPVQIGTNTTVNSTTPTTTTFSSLSIPVNTGNTIYVRFIAGSADAGTRNIRVRNFAISGTTVSSGITSAQTGSWSSTSTWVGGVVPASSANAIIATGHTVTMDVTTNGINTRNSGTTTTVNTGGTLATSVQYINNGTTTINGSFRLNAGGFTNSGNNFIYGSAGILVFNNTSSYGVNNTDQYWPTTSGPVDVTILQGGMTLNSGANRTVTGVFQTAAAVTLTSATLTLNGTVRINTGGSFANAPTYGSASTLVYNTGAAFGRGNEWTTATSGAGYPANVQISNPGTVTTLNMGSSSAQCSGSVTVDASTVLNTTSGGLTVLGSVTTAGTTNTGGALNVTGSVTTNGTITLGGDVTLSGTTASNWVVGATATQTNNNRAVFFTGATGTQTITKTGAGVVFFDYLVINKAAGNVTFSASPATDITLNTTAGDVLQLLNAGALDLNGRTLTLNNSGGNIAANAAGRSITSGVTGATLAITGAKSFSGAGTLIINTNVTTVLSAGFDFGVAKVTVNGVLQLNFGGFATNGSAPTYASSSTLLFNTGGSYDMHNGTADVAGWFRNVASTGTAQAGIPWNVTISANTSVRYNTTNTDNFPRYINGNLIINSGSALTLGGLNVTAGDFFLRGNWTNSGTFTPNSRQVSFNGTTAQTLTGATTFDFFALNNSNGLTLANAITINQTLTLTSGRITLGANNLTLASSGSITGASASNYIVTNGAGIVRRNAVGNTATLFPIGLNTTNYTPVTLTNTTGTSDLSVGVGSTITNAATDATKIVTLQWSVTSNAATTATVTPVWVAANQGAAFTNTGTGELGNYTTSYTTYPVTLSTTTTTRAGVALQSGTNLIVVGNTGAVFTAPPANDNCAGAIALTVGAAAITGNTLGATQTLAGTCAGNANDDVWYSFTTSAAGNYTITVVGSTNFDAVVNFRSGTCNGTNVSCADATANAGTETIVATGLLASTTYFIRVYDFGAGYPATTTFTIAVAPPPAALSTNGTTTFAFSTTQAPLTTTASQTFNLSGSFLTGAPGDITVSAPNTDFQVSNDNSTWGSTATVAYSTGTLASTPVYVRFSPQSSGAKTGNITFSGGGTSGNPTIALTGTSVLPAPVATDATNITATSFDANWGAVTGASSGYLLDVSTSATFGTAGTIASENFENTLTSFTETSGTGTYSTGNSAAGDRPASSPFATLGTYGYGITNGSITITSSNINNTGGLGAQLSFKLASFSLGSTGNGADGGDIVTVEVSPDGGTTYYSTVRVLGNGNAFWDYAATGSASTVYDGNVSPVDFAPASGGSRTTDGYSTVTITGLPSVSNLRIRITLLNNATAERWVIDDLKVTGIISSFVSGYNAKPIAGQSTVTSSVTGLTAGTYYYRLRATDGTPSANSNTITALVTNNFTWNGSSNTNWSTAANWTPAQTPVSTNDATIPGSLSNYPVLSASSAINNLSIASGATVGIAANTLTINGAVSGSGYLKGSHTSNLTINGTAGTLRFNGAYTNTDYYLKNFTINNGASATLGDSLSITGGLSASNEGTLSVQGSGVLTTGGFLTIRSNEFGTARVAANTTSAAYISGNVTVERYIPLNAQKAWRILASNTSGSQTINQAWQEGQIGPLANSKPGYGTMIPGVGANTNAVQTNGFDSLSQTASLYRYNAETDAFIAVTNTNVKTLSSEHGYVLFIRGDRAPGQMGVLAGNVPTSSTTLRSTGALFMGDQTAVDALPNLFGIVRNPYPSRIDLRNINRTNLVDAFQVWDPKLLSGGLGGYQTFTKQNLGTEYEVTPGGGSYGINGSVNNFIESGAAFFIQAGASAGTAQVTENCKVSGSSLVFRPSGTLATGTRLLHSLYAINANNANIVDGGYVDFAAGLSNAIDILDVRKNYNFGENFGPFSGNKDLVVERRAMPTATDTIFYNMYSLKRATYKLEFVATELAAAGVEAYLEDSYKATSTLLNIVGTSSYTFTVDANAASSKANRFRVVFKPLGGPLPVSFTSVKATEQGNNIAVEWKVASQLNVASYEVEKSTNGRSFSKVGTQVATGVSTYNWLDVNAVAGTNYYRIKAIDINGTSKYTQIVKITLGKIGKGFTVSPNPVKGNSFTLQFSNEATGQYQVRLVNITGQVLYKKTIQHAGGSSSQLFTIPSQIISGVYQLEVIAPDKSKQAQKLLIDSNN